MVNRKKNVCVVVLGDIGRSPRMQYHALSLARSNYEVDLIGYGGSQPLPEILAEENITITNLVPLPEFRAPQFMKYFLKIFWQIISLGITMTFKRKSDFVLCQNPPALPTLLICWLYCLLRQVKFIIDWHNYAFSIMALSHRKESLIIKVATYLELYFGEKADFNFCVTKAMKMDLLKRAKITAKVLYDRPPDLFKPISDKERHDFIKKLSAQYSEFSLSDRSQLNLSLGDEDKTILSEWDGTRITLRPHRPGVLFSSTSWTPDEDFKILFDALQDYNSTSIENSSLPKLICVITGKGPMKDYYINLINKTKLVNVKFVTPWLEAVDYPLMVASADLGVCLHTSSSGLDLPMKVVDMFGSGLPVCAYRYQCLDELVQDGRNGYTFETANDLSSKLKKYFKDFPNNKEQNNTILEFKENLKTFQNLRWEENWKNRALPVFK